VIDRDLAFERLVDWNVGTGEAEASGLWRNLEAATISLHDVVVADTAFVDEAARCGRGPRGPGANRFPTRAGRGRSGDCAPQALVEQAEQGEWKSLVTSYPPGWIEMFEPEAARGDGFADGPEGKMIAAVAVGKWESRGFGGISKRSGKPVLGFPRSGFSTAVSAASALRARMRGLCRPVISI
jgi:hypothetical protein